MASIGSLTADLRLESAAFIRDLRKSSQEVAQNTKQMSRQMDSLQRSAANVGRGFTDLRRIITAYVGIHTIRNFVQTADAAKRLEGQLKLVTSGADDLRQTQAALFALAQRSLGSLSGTVELYARLSRTTKELGAEQGTLLRVTEAINQAIVISGSSSDSANAAIIQLSQGLAAGALRGEELNSVMEQTPRLSQAIAEGMGVTIGELRALGKEGKLTSEVIIAAIQSQADTLQSEFQQMPRTVGQALTQLQNQWIRTVEQLDSQSGATKNLITAIDDIRNAIASPEFINGLVVVAKGFAAIAANMGLVAAAAGAIIGGRVGSALLGRLGMIAGAVVGGTEAWLAYKGALESAEKSVKDLEDAAAGVNVPMPPAADGTEKGKNQAAELNAQAEATRAAAEAARALTQAQSEQAQIFADTRTPFEAYQLELAKLNQLVADGTIGWDLYSRAVQKVTDDFQMNWMNSMQGAIGQMQGFTGALAQESKTWFQVNKAFAIAQAIMSTYEGAAKALGQLGAWGIPVAAGIVATGLAYVAMIASQQPGSSGGTRGGRGGSGRGGGGGGNGISDAVGRSQAVNITLQGRSGFSSEQVLDLMEQIGQFMADGVKLNISQG